MKNYIIGGVALVATAVASYFIGSKNSQNETVEETVDAPIAPEVTEAPVVARETVGDAFNRMVDMIEEDRRREIEADEAYRESCAKTAKIADIVAACCFGGLLIYVVGWSIYCYFDKKKHPEKYEEHEESPEVIVVEEGQDND